MLRIRYLVFQFFLILYLFLVAIFSPFIFSKKIARFIARMWQRGVLFLIENLLGVRYDIKGQFTLPNGYMIACKHQSQWETLLTTILFSENKIVAKRELKYIPFFGWYLWRIGTVFLNRAAHIQSIKQLMRDGKAVVESGCNLLIYPEGTRTLAGEPTHYQPGIAALYSSLNVPVVPVALNSGFFWPRKAKTVHPGIITVKILDPIMPGLDKKTFMLELENRIESACLEINEDALRQLKVKE